MNLFQKHKAECASCKHGNETLETLPCEGKICLGCQTKQCVFKCSYCKQQHLTTDPTKDQMLEKFGRIIDDVNEGFQNADLKLQVKCEYLKDEIEISLQSTIDELVKLKQTLTDEITDYEEKCRENIKNNSVSADFQGILNKCQANLSEWNKKSKKFKADEVLSLQAQLDTCRNAYNKQICSDRVMHYRPRQKPIDTTVLGALVYQRYLNYNESYVVDLDRLRDIKEPQQISYKLTNNQPHQAALIHQCYFAAICDNNFFLCVNQVHMNHFKIGLKIFDKTGILINENYENSHLRLGKLFSV
jgi:hypothetical protein